MGKSIKRYALNDDDVQDIELPYGAVPPYAGVQNGYAYIWIELDQDEAYLTLYRFYTLTSDEGVPDRAIYVGSCIFAERYWAIYYEVL